jgi:hypothetical protein
MSDHYTRSEYRRMDIDTLLASDPVYWRTFEAVIGDA